MAKEGGKRSKRGSTSDTMPKAGKGSKAPRAKASKADSAGAIAKLANHPLVTELLAAGAMAAVSAIADHRLAQKAGNDPKNDRKAIKAAGRAAATAIGARLLKQVAAVGEKQRKAKTPVRKSVKKV